MAFLTDNDAKPTAKNELSLPAGADATNYISGADFNELWDATENIRDVVRRRAFDVRHYGAVGDGSTDDSAAFALAAAAVNAVTNTNGTPVSLFFPRGRYLYSSGLSFTRPVVLVGEEDVVLDYQGSGRAVEFGPSNVTSSNSSWPLHRHYGARGITLTGGTNATAGFYFQNYITKPRLNDVEWLDFGGTSIYGAYFYGSNWDIRLENCRYFVSPSSSTVRKWLKVEGTSDSGQSRLSMMNCVGTDQGTVRSYGIYVNGLRSEIAHCKLEGFQTCIQLGPWASLSRILDVYFEHLTTTGGCIVYGADTGDPLASNYITDVKLENIYAHLHSTDFSGLGYLMTPASTSTGLQRCRLQGIYVSDLGARELIKLNTNASQFENWADDLVGVTNLHTTGGSIVAWQMNRKRMTGTSTWDIPSTASGSVQSIVIGVTGAALGDMVACGFSIALPAGCFIVGTVTSTNNVTATFVNLSGSTQDISGLGTVRADVFQR